MVNACGTPGQLAFPPAKLGVTVTVPEIGTCPPFVVEKAAMFPLPEAANPIAVLLLFQLYDVPFPEKLTAWLKLPLQITWFGGSCTVGVGLMVMLKF